MSRHRDYRNRTYSYDEVVVEVERRLDEDGTPYTRDEFIDFYGGTVEWLVAPPYFPPDSKKKNKKKNKKGKKKGNGPSAATGDNNQGGSVQESSTAAAAAAAAESASGLAGDGGGKSEVANPLAKLIAGTVRVTKSDAPAAIIVDGGGDAFAATMSATTGGEQPSAKLLEVCLAVWLSQVNGWRIVLLCLSCTCSAALTFALSVSVSRFVSPPPACSGPWLVSGGRL